MKNAMVSSRNRPHPRSSVPPYILRLPVELITTILLLCNTPVAVSRVSTRLRQLSIGCPTLWTAVKVLEHKDLALLPLFLERSKAALLDIILCFPSGTMLDERRFNRNQVVWVVKLLKPHLYRVQSLSLDYGSDHPEWNPLYIGRHYWGQMILDMFDAPAPVLKSLVVNRTHKEFIPSSLLAGSSPMLKKVRLSGHIINSRDKFLYRSFPLEILTIVIHDIELEDMEAPSRSDDPPQYFEPLLYLLEAHASSLMEVSFDLPSNFYPTPDWTSDLPYPSSHIVMPALHSFSVMAPYAPDLDVLHAPHLRSLHISARYGDR